jgi:hypothetical protein
MLNKVVILSQEVSDLLEGEDLLLLELLVNDIFELAF